MKIIIMDNKQMQMDIKQEITVNTLNQLKRTSRQPFRNKRAHSSMTNTFYDSYLYCSDINRLANYTILHRQQNKQQEIFAESQSVKINKMRDKLNETKDQILLLKARLNFLKCQKQRNQKRRTKNKFYIKSIQTVRQRKNRSEKIRSDIQLRRQIQINELKSQANTMREKNNREKCTAKLSIQKKKLAQAEQERRRKRQQEEQIKRFKDGQLAQKQLKADQVRKSQLQIQKKLKLYNEIRIRFAHNNHRQRFIRTKAQKQNMQKLLQNLKKQELKMLQQYKLSQIKFLQTQKCLQTINNNPQKKGSQSYIIAQEQKHKLVL